MSERSRKAPPCHCLAIRQVSRQITQLYDQHLTPTGLRITQYSVMRVIEQYQPIAMQRLAEKIVMDRTTLSRALRPLERDGLVEVSHGEDARTRLLSLTRAGTERLVQVGPAWDRAQAEFETRFGPGETRELRGMLSRAVGQMA